MTTFLSNRWSILSREPDATRVWIGGGLCVALLANVLISPWAALGVLVFVLAIAARPFDTALAAVATAVLASFVDDESGHLTRELGIVSIVWAYTLTGALLAATRGRWGLPRGGLTLAIAALVITTLVAALRGFAAGHSRVFLGLELVPLLAFTLALVVGGLRIGSADLRRAGALILLASAGHVALGFYSYVTNRIRTGGIYFTPFTGLVALLAFDLALREPRRGVRILYVTITSLCLMHQIISLTRGYWMGLLAGLPLSVALFLLSKSAPAGGWKRVASTSLSVVGVGLLTTIAVSGWFGWGDILALLGTRFASSFGTQQSSETASNVTRLVEWLQAGREILASPWTGQGLGYELHVRHPIFLRTSSQWYVHQMYLWIWLKQGVFGLLALLAAFGAALAMGIRGARTLRGESAAWCATAASSTLYIAALGLTNYPIALVNSTFLLVVLWGIALSLQLPARYRFRWSERTASPDHRQAPVPVRES